MRFPLIRKTPSQIAPQFFYSTPWGDVGCHGSHNHDICHLAVIAIVTINYNMVKFQSCYCVCDRKSGSQDHDEIRDLRYDLDFSVLLFVALASLAINKDILAGTTLKNNVRNVK